MYILVIIIAILCSSGGMFYIKETLKGKTKPNRVTWGIWALAPLIGFIVSISEGVTWSALPVFMSGFIPFLIFLSSFYNKKSYWKLGKLDYICFVFALLSLILWLVIKNPLLAIFFAALTDGIAAIPTIKKIYNYPETETVYPFITGIISASSAFLVMETWTGEEFIFPIYLILINLILVTGYYYKRIKTWKLG